MAVQCRIRKTKGGASNYHIFLNSVKGISKILRLADLSPSEVRVICSKNENTVKRNKSILPPGFEISTTMDPVRPINFYTSTCFEGQDIYDKNGRTFIVSDGFMNHTKIDISTSLIQICGRIRDSHYSNVVTQIYATSKYKDVSEDEFEKIMEKNIRDAESDAERLNGLTERLKKQILGKFARHSDPYIIVRDGQIVVDRNVVNLEIVNYRIVNGTYKSTYNMIKELKDNKLVVDAAYEAEEHEEMVSTAVNMEKRTFKDVFEEYCAIKAAPRMYGFVPNVREEQIEFAKPLIKEAYEKLGAEEVRELNYRIYDIKQALIVKSKADERTKITQMVNQSLPMQKTIPSKKVKAVLERIYKDLGIEGTAKATDLANWYEIKRSTARIDGVSTSCITIVHQYIDMGI